MKKEMLIGYTTGVFDLFHIGHLNILTNAKSLCDYLIVGVTTDKITIQMKGSSPVIPFDERIKIVESIRFVDKVVAKTSTNNVLAWEDLGFNLFFKGDDWKNTKKGIELENILSPLGVKIIYLPYTIHTSSTILRNILARIDENFIKH